jgi:D-alanine-D-alanine ligase
MKTIGIIMGGYSAEFDISINSGQVVYENLQASEYRLFRVILERNNWHALDDNEQSYPIQSDDFSFILGTEKINFDGIFNAVHGHPGEDGPLAGYFDMLRLPYSSSKQFASALTFNKAECNILLSSYGFSTPTAVFLHGFETIKEDEILNKVGLPCFVKPTRSGSSIGISMVKEKSKLLEAIKKAQKIDHKVLIESQVVGLELACGVSDHSGEITALAVTHIKPKNEYFDYESKYSGASEEKTPADIKPEVYNKVMRMSEEVYKILELKGLARVDYILENDANPVLIEVNTVPGLSKQSLLPQQAIYTGLSLQKLFSDCIANTLNSKL